MTKLAETVGTIKRQTRAVRLIAKKQSGNSFSPAAKRKHSDTNRESEDENIPFSLIRVYMSTQRPQYPCKSSDPFHVQSARNTPFPQEDLRNFVNQRKSFQWLNQRNGVRGACRFALMEIDSKIIRS